mmetsp:Transcript_35384/g.70512  ORF Transcript_35384/g.70512 Transcript_35384/m.70512 type:complete len:95 (-) Transcript_35384:124-408(-)
MMLPWRSAPQGCTGKEVKLKEHLITFILNKRQAGCTEAEVEVERQEVGPQKDGNGEYYFAEDEEDVGAEAAGGAVDDDADDPFPVADADAVGIE